MHELPLEIFIIPIIALILVAVFYFILLQGITHKIPFKRFVFITTILAFILNFVWETIQLPLYKNNVYDLIHVSFCALASLADVIMVLLIYFSFALIYKDTFWIKTINIQRAILLILTGGIGAILVELRFLSEGNWAYSSSMLLIPFFNVGISPLLQFMFLPLISYYVGYLFLKIKREVK